MKHPNSARRILTAAAALVAVSALAFALTGCSSAANSTPAPVAQAIVPAPATLAPAAAPGATAPAAATSGPTADQGAQVVKSSCTGRCHGSSLLQQRYPAATAQAIAADMGAKAGLNAASKAAVVAYFAQ